MRYSEFMHKEATIASWISSFRAGLGTLSEAERLLLGTLIIGSGVGGGILGSLTAKGLAHTTADFNLAKKEYQNEQKKADIGYLSRKLNQEYVPETAEVEAPKSVRLLS